MLHMIVPVFISADVTISPLAINFFRPTCFACRKTSFGIAFQLTIGSSFFKTKQNLRAFTFASHFLVHPYLSIHIYMYVYTYMYSSFTGVYAHVLLIFLQEKQL